MMLEKNALKVQSGADNYIHKLIDKNGDRFLSNVILDQTCGSDKKCKEKFKVKLINV